MHRLGGALAAVLLLAACGQEKDPFVEMTGRRATTLIDRDGLLVGVQRDGSGRLCFAYRGTDQGGGRCMYSGWAFETHTTAAGPGPLLLVHADARTAEVRIPTADGGTFTVHPSYVPEVDAHVAAVVTDVSRLRLGGNAAAAYDAGGRLLGHEHNCTSTGGTPDCGPWTGLLDVVQKKELDRLPASARPPG